MHCNTAVTRLLKSKSHQCFALSSHQCQAMTARCGCRRSAEQARRASPEIYSAAPDAPYYIRFGKGDPRGYGAPRLSA